MTKNQAEMPQIAFEGNLSVRCEGPAAVFDLSESLFEIAEDTRVTVKGVRVFLSGSNCFRWKIVHEDFLCPLSGSFFAAPTNGASDGVIAEGYTYSISFETLPKSIARVEKEKSVLRLYIYTDAEDGVTVTGGFRVFFSKGWTGVPVSMNGQKVVDYDNARAGLFFPMRMLHQGPVPEFISTFAPKVKTEVAEGPKKTAKKTSPKSAARGKPVKKVTIKGDPMVIRTGFGGSKSKNQSAYASDDE